MVQDGTHLSERDQPTIHREVTLDEKRELYNKFGMYEAGQSIGIMNLVATLFIVFRFPEHFWILHCVKAFIWIPWRYVRFARRGWEWYLLDFCYFNTYFTVVGCVLCYLRVTYGISNIFHAYNEDFLRVGFAFANGALLWAVFLFNNKIVFHDVDNTCSFYIHYSPNIFFWTIRWGGGFGPKLMEDYWPGLFTICEEYKYFSLDNWQDMFWSSGCSASVRQFLLNPSIVWFIMWGIPYYLLVLCVFHGWLTREKKETLYKTTIEDTKGITGRFIYKLPETLRKLAYMAQHFAFTIATGFLSIVMWNSFAIHTAVLGGVLLLAIHNGSTFMFRVVAAKTIHREVEKVSNKTPLLPSGQTEEQIRLLQAERAKRLPEQLQEVMDLLSPLKVYVEK